MRDGYDRISLQYRDDVGRSNIHYQVWLDQLLPLLPRAARVLDLGCGCGVPATKVLSRNHRVLGVDISPVQIERARNLVPGAEFEVADMVAIDFARESFDAIVSFFAIIHLPLEEQPALFGKMRDWLVPGGWLLATVGHRAWTGTRDDWYGAKMYWSHADEGSYRSWLKELGFQIADLTFIPEGDSGHSLFLAHRV